MNFSTYFTVSSFDIFLGLDVYPICSILMTKLSGVFFIPFSQGILCLCGVTIAKLYPCLEKSETSLLSPWIFISEGRYIWVLLLDKLVTGIDPDLSALSTVSFLLFL